MTDMILREQADRQTQEVAAHDMADLIERQAREIAELTGGKDE